jgi:hypothetical protein
MQILPTYQRAFSLTSGSDVFVSVRFHWLVNSKKPCRYSYRRVFHFGFGQFRTELFWVEKDFIGPLNT